MFAPLFFLASPFSFFLHLIVKAAHPSPCLGVTSTTHCGVDLALHPIGDWEQEIIKCDGLGVSER